MIFNVGFGHLRKVVVFGSRDHLFLAPNYHMTELQASTGRHCHSTLPLAVTGCHWSLLRDLYRDLAVVAAIFCRNDGAALGYIPQAAVGIEQLRKLPSMVAQPWAAGSFLADAA